MTGTRVAGSLASLTQLLKCVSHLDLLHSATERREALKWPSHFSHRSSDFKSKFHQSIMSVRWDCSRRVAVGQFR
jgi:hypothetical protein